MNIIKPSYEVLNRNTVSPYKFIESIGRVCYKSNSLGTEESAIRMCRNLCTKGHLSVLEHYWVHFICPRTLYVSAFEELGIISSILANFNSESYNFYKFIHVTTTGTKEIISAPFRVFLELDQCISQVKTSEFNSFKLFYKVRDAFPELFKTKKQPSYDGMYNYVKLYTNELEFLSQLKIELNNDYSLTADAKTRTLMEHTAHTVKFICDRGISHELVRHRPCSFSQESTRYCNYSKNNFGNEITVIEPFFFRGEEFDIWKRACECSERAYFSLLENGARPEEARSVLPNSLKTEIIVTTNEVEWQHIFDLRAKDTYGVPHPQMKEIMVPCYEELKKLSSGRIK